MGGIAENQKPERSLCASIRRKGGKFAKGSALIARNLNLSDGGEKVPKWRNVSYVNADGNVVQQPMQLDNGKQKEIKAILT